MSVAWHLRVEDTGRTKLFFEAQDPCRSAVDVLVSVHQLNRHLLDGAQAWTDNRSLSIRLIEVSDVLLEALSDSKLIQVLVGFRGGGLPHQDLRELAC